VNRRGYVVTESFLGLLLREQSNAEPTQLGIGAAQFHLVTLKSVTTQNVAIIQEGDFRH
jgi:hypothetical protein